MSMFDTTIFQNILPARKTPFEPTAEIPETDTQRAIEQVQENAVTDLAAVAANDFLVKTASGTLSAERAVTDTATVAVDWATAGQAKFNVVDDSISDAKLRNSAALSLIGRSANSTGDPADIAAAVDGHIMRRSGTAIGFGTASAGFIDFVQSGTGAGSRTAQDKMREVLSVTDFSGVVLDDATDCGAGLNNAIARAIAIGADLWVPYGTAYSSIDLPDIHSVRLRGPGAVRVGTGIKWYVEPSELTTGFGSLDFNTLHVDATNGDNDSSGLAPEFSLQTIQAALDILSIKASPLQGYYEIKLAEGVYAPDASSFSVESNRGQPTYIRGPTVDTWDNSDPPRDPVAISAITAANPPVVSATAHGYSNGEKIFIGLATKSGGAHESAGAIYTVANAASGTFELSGINGTGWSAYTGSGKIYDCNGSAPTAIVYGAGAASDGIRVDGNNTFWLFDLHFINCGTKAGQQDKCGVVAVTHANIRTFNVHASDCSKGVEVRDESWGLVTGGKFYNCYVGNKALHARYTFGSANPGSAALTTTPIYKNCTIGADIWEMASGHVDGSIFQDCVTEVLVRKNAHCVAIYNRYTNSGSAKTGVIAEQGSYLITGDDVWSGSYKPRILRKSSASLGDQGTTYTWQALQILQPGALAANTNEQTLLTQAIMQDMMNVFPQSLRVTVWSFSSLTNDTLTWRLKLGSTTIVSRIMGSNASSRENELVFEMTANGFGVVRAKDLDVEVRAGTTTPRFDLSSPTFDTSGGNQNLTLTAQFANSSDTMTVTRVVLETLGW